MIKVASLFSQVLSMFSRAEFSDIVHQHRGEYRAKGFTCWDQFISMLFCQLAQAHSLNEICNGLQSCVGKIKHLGLHNPPKKSTLAYANSQRPWQIYQDLFYKMLEKCQALAKTKKRKFRFKNKLYSLDGSIIDLCLSMFDWAEFRQTKGAVKLHLLLDHDGYLPTFVRLTTGKFHELLVARKLPLSPGSIVAIDRGYTDFLLFAKWTGMGVYFVTRLKSNISYSVVTTQKLPQYRNILLDQIIRFSSEKGRKECPHLMRRIVAWDAKNEKEVVLLTNHLEFGATTISQIYKERWQVEIFSRRSSRTCGSRHLSEPPAMLYRFRFGQH